MRDSHTAEPEEDLPASAEAGSGPIGLQDKQHETPVEAVGPHQASRTGGSKSSPFRSRDAGGAPVMRRKPGVWMEGDYETLLELAI